MEAGNSLGDLGSVCNTAGCMLREGLCIEINALWYKDRQAARQTVLEPTP